MGTIEEWIIERDTALLNLDMEWGRKNLSEGVSDEVVITSLHKARVECTSLPDAPRLESIEWLRERGFRRIFGVELPPAGVVP
jgi:hypothetical protein